MSSEQYKMLSAFSTLDSFILAVERAHMDLLSRFLRYHGDIWIQTLHHAYINATLSLGSVLFPGVLHHRWSLVQRTNHALDVYLQGEWHDPDESGAEEEDQITGQHRLEGENGSWFGSSDAVNRPRESPEGSNCLLNNHNQDMDHNALEQNENESGHGSVDAEERLKESPDTINSVQNGKNQGTDHTGSKDESLSGPSSSDGSNKSPEYNIKQNDQMKVADHNAPQKKRHKFGSSDASSSYGGSKEESKDTGSSDNQHQPDGNTEYNGSQCQTSDFAALSPGGNRHANNGSEASSKSTGNSQFHQNQKTSDHNTSDNNRQDVTKVQPIASVFSQPSAPTRPMFSQPQMPHRPMFGLPAVPTGSMFGLPPVFTGPMFGLPPTPTGPMFGQPTAPTGPMFGHPTAPTGSMFTTPIPGQLPANLPPTMSGAEAKPQSADHSRFVLEEWYQAHYDEPYAEDEVVDELSVRTGMTRSQVLKWLSNRRNRDGNTKHKVGRRARKKPYDRK